MMSNLFSSFDPSTGIFSLNWLSSLFPMFFFPLIFWYLPNKIMMIFMILLKVLNNELNTLMGYKSLGSSLIFMGLFMFKFIHLLRTESLQVMIYLIWSTVVTLSSFLWLTRFGTKSHLQNHLFT